MPFRHSETPPDAVRRAGTPGIVRSDVALRLRRLLGEEGCPICRALSDHDRSFVFWFLNENYAAPFTIDALARSLGFCRAHGEALVRTAEGRPQLRYVHEALTQRVRAGLWRSAGGRRGRERVRPAIRITGPCPACRSRRDAEHRMASWLAGMLEQPDDGDRYGHPGVLCLPHLQQLLPLASDACFRRLLEVHGTAMQATLDALPVPGGTVPPEMADPFARRRILGPALALCVGGEEYHEPYPTVPTCAPPSAARDPVAEFLAACRTAACPLCLEVRRAWLEWCSWLDGAAGRGADIADLLPTCPDHVWALVREGRPPLALITARSALAAALSHLQLAMPQPPPVPRPVWGHVAERLWGPRRRMLAGRATAGRALPCPVCSRLAVAETRGLALLFVFLQDHRRRAEVAGGYGLCLKHFARATAAAPTAEISDALTDLQDARLAALQWELEESGRKSAWQYRPEARGIEETAWRRAVLRFSGSLHPEVR